MVNPYVLIATHQRFQITKKNIECVLKCGVNVILVVSDSAEVEDYKRVFKKIEIVQHPNQTLGAKWQSGVERARELKADPIIVNGSDDLLHPDFYKAVDQSLSDGFDFVGLKSWYVYDFRKVYQFNYLASLPLGGGRAYSGKLLERINYSLFDPSRDRHLDDLSYGNVLNSKMKTKVLTEPLILSVKGNWPVMNPTNKMFNHPNAKLVETMNPDKILRQFKYV